MNIGVKYCGLCKPEIDATKFYSLLQDKLDFKPEVKLDKYNIFSFKKYDLIIYLNGCNSCCLNEDKNIMYIIIGGMKYNHKKYETEYQLATAVVEDILTY